MNREILSKVMTINETSEIYGINIQTLKNKLKPSIVGHEKIEKWIENGLIRKSGCIWLMTEDFIKLNFK